MVTSRTTTFDGTPNTMKVVRSVWKQGKAREFQMLTYAYLNGGVGPEFYIPRDEMIG